MAMVNPTQRALVLAVIVFASLSMTALGIYAIYNALTAAISAIIIAVSRGWAEKASRSLYSVKVTRNMPSKTSEGIKINVELTICNKSKNDIIVTVQDNTPPRTRPLKEEVKTRLQPGECRKGYYTIKPAPGYHVFPSITLKATDPLGLFSSTRRVKLKESISTYPLTLREYWGSLTGELGVGEPIFSRRKGRSLEFYELREYVPGDDVRLIAWSATARLAKPIVREGLSTISVSFSLVIDLSLESWPGTPGEAPVDWIMRVALWLAEIAEKTGGNLYYAILRGETWEDGPLYGANMADILRTRLSLVGPTNVKRRIKLSSLITRVGIIAREYGPLIILVGPGINYQSLIETISSLKNQCVILGIFAPTGNSLVDQAIRSVERLHYEKYAQQLRMVIPNAHIITSVGEAHVFAEYVENVLLEGTCTP